MRNGWVLLRLHIVSRGFDARHKDRDEFISLGQDVRQLAWRMDDLCPQDDLQPCFGFAKFFQGNP